LNGTAWLLTGIGAAVLLLGIAGGGWIATRAIRPIEDISSTAVKISAGDLSLRIDIGDTETELGRLAGVLNSTFTRLDAAFSQQSRFTSDAAHELRTPVAVILTQTQAALSRERTAVEFRKTVEACQRAAQRMRRLIESLLELARLDAGQEPMQRVRFDLSETIRDCVELIRPLADERKITIHCNLPMFQCDGDPDRLAQVITNLLTNAIQYNEKEGRVQVGVTAEKGMAVLTVADTGQGIPTDDLPHIFDRFYRVDKSRSGSAGRTGLGLAISKAIVAAHSGNIEATSQLGVGTTFTVRLPLESHS
jgi:two-component system, OmpR family, sensor kinase